MESNWTELWSLWDPGFTQRYLWYISTTERPTGQVWLKPVQSNPVYRKDTFYSSYSINISCNIESKAAEISRLTRTAWHPFVRMEWRLSMTQRSAVLKVQFWEYVDSNTVTVSPNFVEWRYQSTKLSDIVTSSWRQFKQSCSKFLKHWPDFLIGR